MLSFINGVHISILPLRCKILGCQGWRITLSFPPSPQLEQWYLCIFSCILFRYVWLLCDATLHSSRIIFLDSSVPFDKNGYCLLHFPCSAGVHLFIRFCADRRLNAPTKNRKIECWHQVWCLQFWSNPMGISNVACTLERAESNASRRSSWVPEQTTRHSQRGRSTGC